MDIEGKEVAGEPDSSEEEERERQDMRFSVEIVPSPMAEPAPPSAPSAHLERRKLFARSKSEKTMCSMPIPEQIEITEVKKKPHVSLETFGSKSQTFDSSQISEKSHTQ
jgi:hypothetical protein